MKVLKSLFRLPINDFPLILRLYFLLWWSKWIIFNRSVEWIINWVSTDLDSKQYSQADYNQIIKVSLYTKKLSKFVPFKSLCYDRALTVKKVLNAKDILSEIHFGVNTSEKALKGHVWIICNDMVVIGEEASNRFKSVRHFT